MLELNNFLWDTKLALILIVLPLIQLVLFIFIQLIYSLIALIIRKRSSIKAFLKFNFLIFSVLFIINIFASLIYLPMYYNTYFASTPQVLSYTPVKEDLYYEKNDIVEIIFDKPINIDQYKIGTEPKYLNPTIEYNSDIYDIVGTIDSIFGTELKKYSYNKVKLIPQNTIPYDRDILYYSVNVTSVKQEGGLHEIAMEYKSPKMLEFESISITNGQKDVSTINPIVLTFTQPVLSNVDLEVNTTPVSKYSLVKNENTITINFDEGFKQGTKYTLNIDLIVNKIGEEDPVIPNKRIVKDLSFVTVNPPGIKSISPKDSYISYKNDIDITFIEAMDKESLVNNIAITPNIEYTTKVSDDGRNIKLYTSGNLKKNTEYKIILKKGTLTQKKGILEKDITHTFKTFGYVGVSDIYPRSGASGVSTSYPISITFDQPVDKSSAQNLIKVSPNMSFKYSWKGNTVTLSPTKAYEYQTRYTISVKSGIKSIDGLDSNKDYTYSFTTRSQIVLLDVPQYSQRSVANGTFMCNLTSTKMALASKGIGVTEQGIINSIGAGTPYNSSTKTGGNPNADWIDNYGVHWGPIVSFVQAYRPKSSAISGMSYSQVAKEISNGNPIIIWAYNGNSNQTRYDWHYTYGAKPGLHSSVIYGFAGSESSPYLFYIRDPWIGTYTATQSQLSYKWSYFGYTAVVVR
mgnify:CR=1 FL=1